MKPLFACYEYLNCNQTDCIMFNTDHFATPCWMFRHSSRMHPVIKGLIESNKFLGCEDKCQLCLYRKAFGGPDIKKNQYIVNDSSFIPEVLIEPGFSIYP